MDYRNYVARGTPVTSESISTLPVPSDMATIEQPARLLVQETVGMRPAVVAISIDNAGDPADAAAVLTGPVQLWGFANRWRVLATLNDGNDIDTAGGYEVGVNLLGHEALLLTCGAMTGAIRWSFTPVRYE